MTQREQDIMDDVEIRKKCEKILAEWWGKTGGDPNVYLYRAAYANGQADARRRAFQSVLEELKERFLEDDELILWVQAQAAQEESSDA